MTEEELLEMEISYIVMDAAYVIDRVGLDNFLENVLLYMSNPEQEQLVNALLNAIKHNTHTEYTKENTNEIT